MLLIVITRIPVNTQQVNVAGHVVLNLICSGFFPAEEITARITPAAAAAKTRAAKETVYGAPGCILKQAH